MAFLGYYVHTLTFHRLPQTTTILFYFWSLWLFSVGLDLCLKQGELTAYKAGVLGYCADFWDEACRQLFSLLACRLLTHKSLACKSQITENSYGQRYTKELTLILTFPFMNRSQAYSSKFSKLCVGFSAARLTLNSIGHMFYWLAGCRGWFHDVTYCKNCFNSSIFRGKALILDSGNLSKVPS